MEFYRPDAIGVFHLRKEVIKMAKILRCNDVGFECDGVIRAETEEEVLKQAAEHARTVHNLQEITDEVVQKVRAAIQDE